MDEIDLDMIAAGYGIKLIDLEIDPDYLRRRGVDRWWYENRSANVGPPGPEIELGFYTDPEKKLASFFHEVAHIVDERWSDHEFCRTHSYYYKESEAWRIGFEIAARYGVEFSDATKQWCKEQLQTYDKDWAHRRSPANQPESSASDDTSGSGPEPSWFDSSLSDGGKYVRT